MPLEFIQANLLTIVIAVASGVMLVWPGLRRAGETVDPGRATLLINRESARIIDVREPHEYAAGHIPDALNLPQKTLAERIGELGLAKDQPLILVCASGVRSGQACAQLKKMGFTRLYNLDGGVGAWERAGLPIKRGSKKKWSQPHAKVLMYTTANCPYCIRAKQLLAARGVTDIEEIRIDTDPAALETMLARTGRRTVPQIYIGDTHVGGCDDLHALDAAGKLAPLLHGDSA